MAGVGGQVYFLGWLDLTFILHTANSSRYIHGWPAVVVPPGNLQRTRRQYNKSVFSKQCQNLKKLRCTMM